MTDVSIGERDVDQHPAPCAAAALPGGKVYVFYDRRRALGHSIWSVQLWLSMRSRLEARVGGHRRAAWQPGAPREDMVLWLARHDAPRCHLERCSWRRSPRSSTRVAELLDERRLSSSTWCVTLRHPTLLTIVGDHDTGTVIESNGEAMLPCPISIKRNQIQRCRHRGVSMTSASLHRSTQHLPHAVICYDRSTSCNGQPSSRSGVLRINYRPRRDVPAQGAEDAGIRTGENKLSETNAPDQPDRSHQPPHRTA